MSQGLIGSWYVYRYNISRHVLKAPETTLEVAVGGGDGSQKKDRLAFFELSGLDSPVGVEMLFDTRTGSWYGEAASIDFRWDRVENSGTVMLVGHASDRTNYAHCDFFIAVRSRRTIELPWPPPSGTYQFGPSYENSLLRYKRIQAGSGISIAVDAGEITFDGTKYRLEDGFPYENGMKIIGSYDKGDMPRSLLLWLLPLDATGRLVATGYLQEMHGPGAGFNTTLTFNTGAGDPMCTKGNFAGG